MYQLPLVTGEIYHVFSKSICGYKIFKLAKEYERMLALIQYYQWQGWSRPLCHFVKLPETKQHGLRPALLRQTAGVPRTVQLIAYCIMETHVHLLVKQLADDGISNFINKAFSGYSLYFNLRHKRHGPLWQSRFGRRHITDQEDLIATSHYIHANPVRDMGIQSPADWKYSSYGEYCQDRAAIDCLCEWQELMAINGQAYQDSMAEYLRSKNLPVHPTRVNGGIVVHPRRVNKGLEEY